MSDDRKILYRTSDIYFAAYLCSIEYDLLTTEEEKGQDKNRKLVFVFKISSSDISRLKASYFGGHGTIKARTFVDNLKSLKSMIYT